MTLPLRYSVGIVFALTVVFAGSPVLANETRTIAKPVFDTSCVWTAIEVRETAVINAASTAAATTQTVLVARKTALQAAWQQTDAKVRRDALKKAWADAKTGLQSMRAERQKAVRAAWSTFNAARKTCKGLAGVDTAGSSVDANL